MPVPLDPSGRAGPTRGQARGPRWQATSHGFYVPADVPAGSAEQRVAEAVPLLPAGGAVTGWAAMRFHEVGFADGLAPDGRALPVPLLAGGGRRPRAGVVFLQHDPEAVVSRYGVPCVPLTQAVFDEMRRQSGLREAVVVADMGAATGLISIAELRDHVSRQAGRPGARLARTALDLAVDGSASPPESRLRLIWVLDAGWPIPLVNVPVFDLSGRLLGYPDLLDVVAGLVVEYDGADHRAARRHSDDVDREARMRAAGLEVTRITSLDLLRPERALARLREARSRAPFTPTNRRRWTLEAPEWFRPELSEADRRALYG